MSYLFEENAERPPNAPLAGPFQGVISKAPGDVTDSASVVLRAMSRDGFFTPPRLAALIAAGTPEFPNCMWQPRVDFSLPVVGNVCLVTFDDTGAPWIIAWWPYPIPL